MPGHGKEQKQSPENGHPFAVLLCPFRVFRFAEQRYFTLNFARFDKHISPLGAGGRS